MARLFKALAFAIFTCFAGAAQAAVDLCPYVPYFPGRDVSFETSAYGMDQLGCRTEPVSSAHYRIWHCGTGDDEVGIALHRAASTSFTFLTIMGRELHDMRGLENCAGRGVRLVRGAAFEPGSLALADRMDLHRGYATQGVYLLSYGDMSVIVTGTGESPYLRSSPVQLVERSVFGYSRTTFGTTAVEIAGVNLYAGTTDAILSALAARGATITNTEPIGRTLRDIALSPPIGLEGVTSITLMETNGHALLIGYNLSGAPAYEAFVAILDSRYGRSVVRNGTGENRACRFRIWTSGVVTIQGEFCAGSGYKIMFANRVANEQSMAASAALRALNNPQRPRPRIDPDNL